MTTLNGNGHHYRHIDPLAPRRGRHCPHCCPIRPGVVLEWRWKSVRRVLVDECPSCPTTPVEVVVSVDQWGGIVSELGGACAKVTTLLASSSVDPHDYEPSPADAVKFSGAQLVVVNGGHYDEWATKLAAGSAPAAPIVDAVQVSGLDQNGTNSHTWYSPTAVTQVADAVTAQLSKLAAGFGWRSGWWPNAAPRTAARQRHHTVLPSSTADPLTS
jgi:hypothetical protein